MKFSITGSEESLIEFKSKDGKPLYFIQKTDDGRWICGFSAWETFQEAIHCALCCLGEPNIDKARRLKIINRLRRQLNPEV